jgi:serine/threonine protein kinase
LRVPSGEDRPVVWNILHDAKRTEHICAFLEHVLDGVKFLAHYQVPQAISEEDDIDLLDVMRRQVIHPLCEEMDDDLPHGASYGEGGGSLVGIDVDSLSRSVTHVDDDPSLPESERRVYSITKFVHPLRQRTGYFAGDPDIMDDTVLLFNRVHSTLLALGDGSEGGGSDDDNGDDENDGGGGDRVGKLHLADLNAEYSCCKVKVVDLGNACWTFKHFTDDIQTRQYRSPEVLLGADYNTSADMWSLGCIVFELLTGDLLFDPRSGSKWDREEDHLAMMMELVGNFPASVYRKGKRASQYFSSVGELRNIAELKFWPLEDVLMDKYRFSEEDAKGVAAFLTPVLTADPAVRATAKECVAHPWLVDA